MMKPAIWIMKHANNKKKTALGPACAPQMVFFPSVDRLTDLAHTILARGSALRLPLFQVPRGALQSLTWTLQLLGS